MRNEKTRKRARLFNIRLFPMDLARILCMAVPFFFNIKKIYVSEKAKKKLRGRVIISANHTCIKDPLLISSCFWYRRMFHLTAEAVMEKKHIDILLRGVGCVKINRNICDIESIKKATDILNQGHAIAIFPQGGIKTEDDINSIKSGIILVAMRAKAPIVPCYVHNKAKKGDRNCIVIGEPLDFFCNDGIHGMKEINELAEKVLEKINECKRIFENSRRD